VEKAIIVNCFETFQERVENIFKYFKSKGLEVSIIQSDFMHFKNQHVVEEKDNYTFIESKPYYNNISVNRIFSHMKFAKDTFEVIEKLTVQPDLIYVILPPKSLAKQAIKYKAKNTNTKIVFDVMDLWPEAFTMGNSKMTMFLKPWTRLRSQNLNKSDFVITECNYFRNVLNKELLDVKNETLYLTKADSNTKIQPNLSEDEIHMLYLGSINTIIDINLIVKILSKLNKKKKVIFHIIGDVENRENLIKEISNQGIEYTYHGIVYDSQKKQEIINECHFGINIMRENIAVGLTMKFIDYFQFGLPIINNIQENTEKIVEINEVGLNITTGSIDSVIEKINGYSTEKIVEMKFKSGDILDKYFSVTAFSDKLDEIFYRF